MSDAFLSSDLTSNSNVNQPQSDLEKANSLDQTTASQNIANQRQASTTDTKSGDYKNIYFSSMEELRRLDPEAYEKMLVETAKNIIRRVNHFQEAIKRASKEMRRNNR